MSQDKEGCSEDEDDVCGMVYNDELERACERLMQCGPGMTSLQGSTVVLWYW